MSSDSMTRLLSMLWLFLMGPPAIGVMSLLGTLQGWAGALLGIGLSGVALAGVLAINALGARRQRRIRAWAEGRLFARRTETDLDTFNELVKYAWEADGLRVTYDPGDRRGAPRASLRFVAPLLPGEVVDIRRRGGRDAGGIPTGNVIFDSAVIVVKAPPRVLALLADEANLEATMRLMHGYKRWSIQGSGELVVEVAIGWPARADDLEAAFQAGTAIARLLAAPEAAKLPLLAGR